MSAQFHLDAIADPATRLREYSPSSAIGGNYGPHIERYRRDSARALATLRVARDLRYGTAERMRLDWFPASGTTRRPGLLVFIHGGYWQELSKDDSAFLAPAWHAAGYAHATIGYTLGPEASLPRIVDECCQALAWLGRYADPLGFDVDNVVVAGSSAGGYLTAACAARAPLPIRGIVPISGIFDVSPLIGTSINDALGLDLETAASLNLLDSGRRWPASVVAWGEVETHAFAQQSRIFADVVRASGAVCACLEIPRRNHFDVVHELGDPATPLFAAVTKLFTSARS